MRKILLSFLFTGLLVFVFGGLIAQTVDISAEVRPRYEFRHGYKTLFPDDAKPASFISQRTRLNGYFANDNFKVFLSLQDVRVWGDVNQLNTKDINGFSVHQAWAQLKLSDFLQLKVGRQEIIYDDHRIFGSVGWAQQARSHDAAIFKFLFNNKHQLDFGFALNAMKASLTKVAYTNNNYKAIQWLHYHIDFNKSGLSILFLNNGLAYDADTSAAVYDEKVSYSQTIGGRYSMKGDDVKFNIAAYYQGGKNRMHHDLSAMYFGGNVSFHMVKNFAFGLGFEYLSGTSSKDKSDPDKKDKSFTPFYGTNHKFNGWMDYFYVGNHGGNVGLIDVFLPLKLKVEKVTFALIPHYLMTAAQLSMPVDADNWKDYGSGLGTEIDFSVGYQLSKSVNIMAGYSQMLATETMQALKYADNATGEFYKNNNNWAWVMLTFKPTFYSK